MQRIIISVSILLALGLSGCTFFPGVHKIDIQQGNLVTQEMINKLKPGMSRSQVRYVLGTPLVADTFEQDRWDYFYSLKPGADEVITKRLTLYFEDEKLARFSGDYRPSSPSSEAAAQLNEEAEQQP